MKILVEIAVRQPGGQGTAHLMTEREPVYQSIELNDFLGWYDLHHWHQQGGQIAVNSVPGMVELFIRDEIKVGGRHELGDRK
jgi:hypothetical protein